MRDLFGISTTAGGWGGVKVSLAFMLFFSVRNAKTHTTPAGTRVKKKQKNTTVKNNVTIGGNHVLHLNQTRRSFGAAVDGWQLLHYFIPVCWTGPFLSDGDATGGLTLWAYLQQ